MDVSRASRVWPATAAVLVAVLIIGGTLLAEKRLWRHSREGVAADHLSILNRNADLLTTRTRARVNDLFMLKGILQQEISHDSPAAAIDPDIRIVCQELMLSRGTYDQIRLLSPEGREIYRLNATENDEGIACALHEVPAQELQDKSDRPYYQETLRAPRDAAVFSPFDLNVEQGKIEQPPKPTIRISGKIYGPDGTFRAVLVMNYLGHQLTRGLIAPNTHVYLLNADGFWLIGPTPQSEWAFMDPARQQESLKVSSPEIWSRVKAEPSGTFFSKDVLYCFRNIDPFAPPIDYPLLLMSILGGDRLRFTLLDEVPAAEIWRRAGPVRWAILMDAMLSLAIFVPLAWMGTSALQEVARMRRRLDRIVQTSQHGIAVLEAERDQAGRIVDLNFTATNAACEALTGRRVGERFLGSNPSADRGNFTRYCQIIETGQPASFEHFYRVGDAERWLGIHAARMGDGAVVSIVDLTEGKHAEERLRHQRHLLQMAEKISGIGAWSVEYPARALIWSQQVFNIYELEGNQPWTVEEAMAAILPEYRETVRAAFEKCAADGTPYDQELEMTTAKGRCIWVRAMGEAEFQEGRLRRVVGTFQDITEIKRAQDQERKLVRKALAAERAKSDFLAVMSHEIRTPMNGILGFADQLASRPLQPEEKEFVQTIQQCGNALLRILDDILDYSRIESGRVDIEKSVFSPVELVQNVRTLLSSTHHKEGVSLQVEIEPGIPARVFGDGGRVRQILVNLVGNALKFTERGRVLLGLRRLPPEAGGGPGGPLQLQFFVQDTGIGIPQEKLRNIFEPFLQADSSISRRYGGTGLGLAISWQLAELMGGTLKVESEEGKGSTFLCTLPLEAVREVATEPGKSSGEPLDQTFAQRHPLEILVAEDDTINMKVASLMLGKFGYRFRTATSGQAAVDLYREHQPDCILMDLHMPELDGLEATQQIRILEQAREAGKPPVFISALTAAVLPEERQRCFQAGIDDYLAKPLRQDALAEVLRRASSRRAGA